MKSKEDHNMSYVTFFNKHPKMSNLKYIRHLSEKINIFLDLFNAANYNDASTKNKALKLMRECLLIVQLMKIIGS